MIEFDENIDRLQAQRGLKPTSQFGAFVLRRAWATRADVDDAQRLLCPSAGNNIMMDQTIPNITAKDELLTTRIKPLPIQAL